MSRANSKKGAGGGPPVRPSGTSSAGATESDFFASGHRMSGAAETLSQPRAAGAKSRGPRLIDLERRAKFGATAR